jgi:hypothetical protein
METTIIKIIKLNNQKELAIQHQNNEKWQTNYQKKHLKKKRQ